MFRAFLIANGFVHERGHEDVDPGGDGRGQVGHEHPPVPEEVVGHALVEGGGVSLVHTVQHYEQLDHVLGQSDDSHRD